MNFNQTLDQLKIDRDILPKNVILSKNNFFDDVSISSMCIYRGSTSVITALQSGVYPIYFNISLLGCRHTPRGVLLYM